MTAQPIFDALERPASNSPLAGRADERAPDVSFHLRTQLLRRIAHDIASPAGVTMTVLEELAYESARPELVAMARRGLRRLLRLSEQLALAADLEMGTFSPDRTLEDVRAVAKDALEQAVTIDGRREIATSCDVPTEKLIVDVDRRLVSSVLREVVGNALKLASSRVAVKVRRDGSKVAIVVDDDGPGFAPETRAALGQRFTPRSTLRGLGLSLSMAKDILSAHGGGLHVETSALPPGRSGVRGASVVLTLPLL